MALTLKIEQNYFLERNTFPNFKIQKKIWQPFIRVYKPPNEFVDVNKNELLLGYEPNDFDYETKVTIPFNPNRRITIVITGDNDAGKSVFAQFIIGQLRFRFNRYIAFIDPKDDTYNLEKPNKNPYFVEILKKYKIQPHAHNFVRIYPKFAGMLGVNGIPFAPSLKDFQGTDKIILIERLAQFFELEKGDPALQLLSAVMLSKKPPNSIKELLDRIEEMQESGIGERVKKLKSQILTKKLTEQLSDETINIPLLLKQHGMVVLKVPLIKEQSALTDSIASLFISNIMAEREKTIITGEGYLERPVSIVCDEADKYAGTNTITNSLISQITTKFRSLRNTAGLDSILITQHASYLDPTQVLEADYIFGVRLNMQQDIELLKARAGAEIYNMQELEYIIGHHPKIFWCLDKNGEVKYFRPLPTMNSMPSQKERTKVVE